MDFTVPAELRELVDRTRRFRLEELAPLEAAFLESGTLDNASRRDLQASARKRGLWGVDVEPEFGGLGHGHLGLCLTIEELYRSPLRLEFGGSPEPCLFLADEDQRERFLRPVLDGAKQSCFAFSEPQAGSDFGHLETVIDDPGGDIVRVTGRKMFIGLADVADFVILFATTDPAAGAHGVTCLLVESGSPGYEIVRPMPTMGDDWLPFELAFHDCAVPKRNILGGWNAGFAVAAKQLTHGRLKIAAIALGIARRALDEAVAWAKERTTWGKPIATRQGVQWMLADSLVELEAARLLVHRAAWMADTGQPIQNEAFMAKLAATEMADRVTDRCLQVLGGRGYLLDSPVQSLYRQARLWRIGHGTSEIHRWMIARNMLGLGARDD
ncbi:acyl-CoA dehydrogenase family protein [Actinomadura graeca]|uniref:Acyl-CoA dehydrogenase family protein n=1 Tax=Actinomadura graeca TaxID=2750812 RepID=A0ABX8QTV1_9ACTN|nr:acyl-CoA dehydrogenase family protein [Actinomadura graeca]QXJ21157.1 acyl-CoA dehydrogenase family protein [Actinomadura graeca]